MVNVLNSKKTHRCRSGMLKFKSHFIKTFRANCERRELRVTCTKSRLPDKYSFQALVCCQALDFIVKITSHVEKLILDFVSPSIRISRTDHLIPPPPCLLRPLLLGTEECAYTHFSGLDKERIHFSNFPLGNYG